MCEGKGKSGIFCACAFGIVGNEKCGNHLVGNSGIVGWEGLRNR